MLVNCVQSLPSSTLRRYDTYFRVVMVCASSRARVKKSPPTTKKGYLASRMASQPNLPGVREKKKKDELDSQTAFQNVSTSVKR